MNNGLNLLKNCMYTTWPDLKKLEIKFYVSNRKVILKRNLSLLLCTAGTQRFLYNLTHVHIKLWQSAYQTKS